MINSEFFFSLEYLQCALNVQSKVDINLLNGYCLHDSILFFFCVSSFNCVYVFGRLGWLDIVWHMRRIRISTRITFDG